MSALSLAARKRSGTTRVKDGVFRVFIYAGIGVALLALGALVISVVVEGRSRLNMDLIRNMPSARPSRAGIQSAIFGTLWVVGLTAAMSLPAGIGAAIYLEEFANRGRWYNKLIALNIQNLAAVPSVVFGILGLAFIKRGALNLGSTVITASLVLAVLILPTIVIVSREAIRAVPDSLRQSSMALGATKWQTVWRTVLPSAIPGIATGSILSISRAIGESAPLLMLGALTFITFNPSGIHSQYTVLPIQIFSYVSNAKSEFKPVAAASIVVLLIILLVLNSIAVLVRKRFRDRNS